MSTPAAFRADAAPSYVRSGETLVWFGKPTLRSLASLFVGLSFTLLFVLPAAFASTATRAGTIVPLIMAGVILVLLALTFVFAVLRLRRTEYVITRTGIYTRTGIIGTSVVQTTFDKITDIEIRQDVLGRIFGYGTLQVNTAGSSLAPIQMHGLVDPIQAKSIVERTKDEFLERETSPPQGSRTLAYFTPRDEIRTFPCPQCGRSFPRPRTDAGKRALCPHCDQYVRLEVTSRAPRRVRR